MTEWAALLNGLGNLLSAVLWPAVVSMLIYLYRNEIRGLINRIRLVKMFGAEAEFLETDINRLWRGIVHPGEETEPPIEEEQPGRPQGNEIVDVDAKWKSPDALLLAMKDPHWTLERLSTDIEEVLFQLAMQHSLDVTKAGVPVPQVALAIARLQETGVISVSLRRSLETFLELSSAVVLGGTISQAAFAELFESGIVLYDALQELTVGTESDEKVRVNDAVGRQGLADGQ